MSLFSVKKSFVESRTIKKYIRYYYYYYRHSLSVTPETIICHSLSRSLSLSLSLSLSVCLSVLLLKPISQKLWVGFEGNLVKVLELRSD